MFPPKYKYPRKRLRDTRTGKIVYSSTHGDAISRALMGMKKAAIMDVARANGFDDTMEKHYTKNPGHFRMIVGQALRERVLRGQPVRVRKLVISRMDQPVPLPSYYEELPVKEQA